MPQYKMVIDTEGTGVDLGFDRIVSLSFRIFDMETRKQVDELYLLVNPEQDVGDSEKIHGLSNEMLENEPTFAELAETICQKLFQYDLESLIIHNADYDILMLQHEFERLFEDHNILYTEYVSEKRLNEIKRKLYTYEEGLDGVDENPNQCLPLTKLFNIEDTYKISVGLGMPRNSLNALSERFGVDLSQREHYHGAHIDTKILADLYFKMTDEWGDQPANIEETLESKKVPPIRVPEHLQVSPSVAQQCVQFKF